MVCFICFPLSVLSNYYYRGWLRNISQPKISLIGSIWALNIDQISTIILMIISCYFSLLWRSDEYITTQRVHLTCFKWDSIFIGWMYNGLTSWPRWPRELKWSIISLVSRQYCKSYFKLSGFISPSLLKINKFASKVGGFYLFLHIEVWKVIYDSWNYQMHSSV